MYLDDSQEHQLLKLQVWFESEEEEGYASEQRLVIRVDAIPDFIATLSYVAILAEETQPDE
jgi:hypothetical protein